LYREVGPCPRICLRVILGLRIQANTLIEGQAKQEDFLRTLTSASPNRKRLMGALTLDLSPTSESLEPPKEFGGYR
jgi:hypothetical protein